ncbi:MAG: Site-specific recombinase XerC [Rhizobium sp.]|nr:Site-specific recombinase XerC [Rhizobium sp.]
MSLYKTEKSPYYAYDFKLGGRRFYGSTKATNKKDAEAVERELKAKAKADVEQEKKTGHGPMTLDILAGRYMNDVGNNHVNVSDTHRDIARIITRLGPDKRADQISDDDMARLIALRKKDKRFGKKKHVDGRAMETVSNATINRGTTAVLKKLLGYAKRRLKMALPVEPNWRDHWLKENDERVRELNPDEGDALDTAVREDYGPWLEFARLTGWRRETCLIRWSNVNIFSKQITRIGKSGRKVTTPITPSIAAILEECKGHHPEWVFTYIAKRADKEEGRARGHRYPITYAGAGSEWQRLRKRSGLVDFRFHDIRHDVATKTLRETKNLKLVSKVLGHTNISTTMKYAHVLDDEVADALETVAMSRKKVQNKEDKSA